MSRWVRIGVPLSIALAFLGMLGSASMAAVAMLSPPGATVELEFESTPASSTDPGFSNDNIVLYRDGHGDYGHGNRKVHVKRSAVFGASVAVVTGGPPVECTLRVNGREVSHATAEGPDAVASCYWYA